MSPISAGAAAGLAIGATLDILLLFGIAYYYYHQRRQRISNELEAQRQHDQETAVAVAAQIRRHHHHTPPDRIPSRGRTADVPETTGDQESTDTGCYTRAASLDQRIMTWRDQSSSRSENSNARRSHSASPTSPFASVDDPVELPASKHEKSIEKYIEAGVDTTDFTFKAGDEDVSSMSLNDTYEKRSATSTIQQRVSLAKLSDTSIESESSHTERQESRQSDRSADVAELGIQLSPVGDSFAAVILGSGYSTAESTERRSSESISTNLSTNLAVNHTANPAAIVSTSPTPATESATVYFNQTPSPSIPQISANPPTLPPPAWTRESASLPVSLFTLWNGSRASSLRLDEHKQNQSPISGTRKDGTGSGYWVL